mmetsp:Transcript_15476/g.23777  ORF Transcript_15476/g.23777 Transcript_15476/m.23777 type:complete len:109 (+) Transcript_15476:266-592(+)|eukprot:CAMPEP_0170513456 /NCGR_PEP_ID=MMETSP0208-20121228/67407_1 /TAXON_ID=197538 /ORGANISM="Strombidium inclinatum, Strain S3" /LENGTH=108 /DNA_ID=CAMNT_0010797187 /DNA_START=1369 /DNA_END=1695 /DNA_ORIENTATION=+
MFDEFANLINGVNTDLVFKMLFDQFKESTPEEEADELFGSESPSQMQEQQDLKQLEEAFPTPAMKILIQKKNKLTNSMERISTNIKDPLHRGEPPEKSLRLVRSKLHN